MSGWDDIGDVAENVGWNTVIPPNGGKISDNFGGGDGGFNASSGFGGGDTGAAGGDAAGGESVLTCRYCKLEGHFTRDCPTKPDNDGGCFNCGEQGHSKVDCPNPKKFTGTCRHCGEEGHGAKECPKRPPQICRNCLQDGHVATDCTNPRKLSYLVSAEDLDQETAWDLMKAADAEEDFDEFKVHMLEYIKASPTLSLDELETAFRSAGFHYYLYALTMDITYDKCLVGIHGEKDAEYLWSLNKSARPRRSKAIAHRMAATAEENLVRLKHAGSLEDELGPLCHQCKEKGHIRANCKAEPVEDDMKDRVVLKCFNCQSLDHRLRDCPQPRKNWDACRNCGEGGHRASECENPRVANADTECRSCGGKGHFSKDCPDKAARGPQECYNCGEEGHRSSDCTNERVIKCRNCDERGHSGKECPKPRDMARVKCNNCGEMGHFSRTCTKAPEPEPEADPFASSGDTAAPTPINSSWAKAKGPAIPTWGAGAEVEQPAIPSCGASAEDDEHAIPAWGGSAEVGVSSGW